MQLRTGFSPSPITLGSAQFGLAYGIANARGQPSEAEVFATLDAALDAGVTTIDTARTYGLSEYRIGRWLATRRPASVHVVTKVPALPRGTADKRRRALFGHLRASTQALGIEPLPLVLAHDESDLLDPDIVDAFQLAMEKQLIDGFGASAYRPDIAADLIETVPIVALQVPANIVDRRFEQAGIFAIAAARGIAVFTRSVFLQGALIGQPELLPPYLEPLARAVKKLQRIAEDAGCSLSELLIPPIRDIPGATSLVVGVDNAGQLAAQFRGLRAAAMPAAVMDQVRDAVADLPPEFINPAMWKSLAERTRPQA